MHNKLTNVFKQVLGLPKKEFRCQLHHQANVFCDNEDSLQIYCQYCIYKQHHCKELKIRYISQFITHTKQQIKQIQKNIRNIQGVRYKSILQNQSLKIQKICLKFQQKVKNNRNIYQQKCKNQKRMLKNFIDNFTQQIKNTKLFEAGGKIKFSQKIYLIQNEVKKFTNQIQKVEEEGNKNIMHEYDSTIKKLKELIETSQFSNKQNLKQDLHQQLQKKQQEIQKLQSELIQLRSIKKEYQKLKDEKQQKIIIQNISSQFFEYSVKYSNLQNQNSQLKKQNLNLIAKCSQFQKIQQFCLDFQNLSSNELKKYQIGLNENSIYKKMIQNKTKIMFLSNQLQKNRIELKDARQNVQKLKIQNQIYKDNQDLIASINYKSSRKSSDSFELIEDKQFKQISKLYQEIKEQKQKNTKLEMEIQMLKVNYQKKNINTITESKKQIKHLNESYENKIKQLKIQITNLNVQKEEIKKQNLRLKQEILQSNQIVEQNKQKLRKIERSEKIFSHLIIQQQKLLILNYLESNKIYFQYSQLIFNAKIHKFSSNQFLNLCNNLPRLLIIVKTINSNIIGGFIESEYGSQQIQITKSFIFNLNKNYFANIKQKQVASKIQDGCGPIFGKNSDLKIKQNKLYSNYHNKRSNYEHLKHNFSEQTFFLDGKVVLEIQNYQIYQLK